MRIFVTVFFIVSLIGSITKAIQLMYKDYPRVETFSIGEDCARLVESVAMCLWAAYVVWG